MSKSCVGCKFLYEQDSGYSNYTVMDTSVVCAKDLNKDLPSDEPYDWRKEPDNWPKTMYGRCDQYAVGPSIHLDVDGEDYVEDQTEDAEVREAILKSSGRDAKPTADGGVEHG